MIRVSVLGAADIAVRSILPLLTEEHGFELVGIGYRESSFEKAKKVANDFGAKPIALEEILDGIDALYIPYPPALHFEWIMKALDKGIHVLCEKPLSISVTEATQIEEHARKKRLVVLENYMFLRHGQHNKVKELLPEIGDLRVFRAAFAFPPFPNSEDIRYHSKLGGGALLDCSGYPIQAAMLFLGEDLKVEACGLTEQYAVDQGKVDIYGDLSLRSSSGIPAQIYFGFDHAYQCVYELYGTKGVLRVPKAYTPRANYSPSIELIRNGVLEVHSVPAEDHFLTTLVHFRALIEAGDGFSEIDWKRTMVGVLIQQEMRECALKNQSM